MLTVAALMSFLSHAPSSVDSPDIFEDDHAPYCGLYCVLAAASTFGNAIKAEQIFSKRYLSSTQGSSTEDLQRALVDHGLSGEFYRSMSLSQLIFFSRPAILHTRSGFGTAYGHWMLFLGMKDNHVQVYDPPRRIALMTKDELMSVWDGSCIIVNDPKKGRGLWTPPLEGIIACISALGCFLLLRKCKRAWVVLLSTTLVTMAIYWATSPLNMAADPNALANVVFAFHPRSNPTISFDDFERARANTSNVVVDARPKSMFNEGHLPGAVNVSIESGYFQLRDQLKQLPKKSQIIVYCNNEQCGWADTVANEFSRRGFRDVHIFRGGYSDWVSRQPRRGK